MTALDNIPAELRALPRWVCCGDDAAASLGVSPKTPMKPWEVGAASVSEPATWGTFEEACEAVEGGIYDWLGFVFDGDGYVGIDIDHAFDDDGMPTDDAAAAIAACRSYAELSRSGDGFHIICRAELPFDGAKVGRWEAYRKGRFFLLTGNLVGDGILSEAQAGVDAIVERHLKAAVSTGKRKPRIWEPTYCRDGRWHVTRPSVGEGSRHISLVSYCGQVKNWAAREEVLTMARRANELWLDPPLPDSEVMQIWRSTTRRR